MNINAEIVKALGLQDQKVTRLVLTFEVGKAPTAEVTRIVDASLADRLLTAVEVLKLKPVAE